MTTTRLAFIIPEDHGEIAELLADNGAEGDLLGLDDTEAVAAYLGARVGGPVEVEFDADDPTEPLYDLMHALDRAKAPYWAGFDGFVERSRGLRVPPRVFVKLEGAERAMVDMDWVDGTPSLDVRAMARAGIEPGTAEAAAQLFEGRAPPPAP